MSARQDVLAAVDALGLDIEDSSGPGELLVSLWSPAGTAFAATGCHSLSVVYYSDRPAGWADLAADLRAGLEACTDDECDTCNDR